MHARGRKTTFDREALQTVFGTGNGGLGHQKTPLGRAFSGNYAGSLIDRSEKVSKGAIRRF
jgi:hypothetical protein